MTVAGDDAGLPATAEKMKHQFACLERHAGRDHTVNKRK